MTDGKAFAMFAAMGLTALLAGCSVSPVGCPLAGHRVDKVFDTIEAPVTATIVEDEPGSCQSGEPATALRHYQPNDGTQAAEVVTTLADTLTRKGWTDVTPRGPIGSIQPSYSTTIDARRYVATIDDSHGDVWLYLTAG